MKKKQVIDLIISIFLILAGAITLILPLINVLDVKLIFYIIMIIYIVLNLIQFFTTISSKDFEGLFTAIASLITLVVAYIIHIDVKPWNLAIALFIWIIMMALIKLKKSDYYNDRKSKMWILKMVCLALFILNGILCTVNLYYTADVQILVIGFFFLIHGILELVDPVTIYLMGDKK